MSKRRGKSPLQELQARRDQAEAAKAEKELLDDGEGGFLRAIRVRIRGVNGFRLEPVVRR